PNVSIQTNTQVKTIEKQQEGFNIYSRVQSAFRKYNLEKELAKTFFRRAIKLRELGLLRNSEKYFKKAESIYLELGYKELLAYTYNDLSILYRDFKEYDQAWLYCEKTIELSVEINDHINKARGYANKAELYYFLGYIYEALYFYDEANKIYSDFGIHENEAFVDLNRIDIELNQGEYELVERKLTEIEKLFKTNRQNINLAYTYDKFGHLYYRVRNFDKAIKYFEKALKIFKKYHYKLDSTLIELYITLILKETGKVKKAIQLLEGCEKNAKISNHQEIIFFAHLAKGLILRDSNKKAAESAFIKAINTFENARGKTLKHYLREGFYGSNYDVYRYVTSIYLSDKRANNAIEIIERSKAKLFLEILRSDRIVLHEKYEIDAIEKLESVKKQLHFFCVEAFIQEIKIKRETDEQIKQNYISGFGMINDLFHHELKNYYHIRIQHHDELIQHDKLTSRIVKPRKYKQLKKEAFKGYKKDDVLFIAFYQIESQIHFLMFRNNDETKIKHDVIDWPEKEFFKMLPPSANHDYSESIESQIFRSLDNHYPYFNIPKSFLSFSEKLIDKIHLHAKKDDTIIIVPDDNLRFMPFNALCYEHSDNGNEYLRFLIEDYPIAITPNISIIGICKGMKRKKKDNILAVGNPNPPADLIQGEKEAESIARLFGAKALVGKKANKNIILEKAPDVDVLHFSCHSLFMKKSPFTTGIILADKELLDVDEIANKIVLNANLVTLSACETALHSGLGNEMIGLIRSFIYAGSPSVIASIWRVDDKSTKQIFLDFYKLWKKGNLTKAKALQQSQIAHLKRARKAALKANESIHTLNFYGTQNKNIHPYFWGSFQLYGDWV
ncbi:MAG: CHAT domain-containing protein, partial [Candidatus Thorarchaeota archaeon]